MHAPLKLIVAAAALAAAGITSAQTTTGTVRDTGRSAAEMARDGANAVGRAASAAVTPGDQNMGRTPNNRSGGMMGTDRTTTGTTGTGSGTMGTTGTTSGTMGTDSTGSGTSGSGMTRRASRSDRG